MQLARPDLVSLPASCFGQGEHYLSPGARKFGEAVEKQDAGSSVVAEASLQDMHLETVAVVHKPERIPGGKFVPPSERS